MKLIPVDPANEAHLKVLYDLLAERPAYANISHKKMPTWEEHVAFVERVAPKDYSILDAAQGMSQPSCNRYADWCLLEDVPGAKWGRVMIGAIYLTRSDEIGIGILNEFGRQGFGPHAIECLMLKHGKRPYLANIGPSNAASIKMFSRLGFRLIQYTYKLGETA